MEHTKINHSPLITAIENFVEDTIERSEPWEGYWTELADLLRELQEQYDSDLNYSAYNQAMIKLMFELEQNLKVFQSIKDSTVKHLCFSDVKSGFEKFERKHKKEVEHFKADELKNREKAIEYAELLLEHYSKSLVVRVDLSYRQEKRTFIDILDFRKDVRKLLDRLQDRDRHFKGLHGYIFALEQGAQKGYHAHFLLFYNGSQLKADRHIADSVIKTWKKITDDTGIGYTSNSKESRDSYKATGNDALGCFNRGDIAKKNKILNMVRYFAKPDKTEQRLLVRVKNMQSFGHGKFKTPTRRSINETIARVRLNIQIESRKTYSKR